MMVILFIKRGVEGKLYHISLSFYFSEQEKCNLELEPNGSEERWKPELSFRLSGRQGCTLVLDQDIPTAI